MRKIIISAVLVFLVASGVTAGTYFLLKFGLLSRGPIAERGNVQNVGNPDSDGVALPTVAENKEAEDLPSEFIIKTVDIGDTRSDKNGVVTGTVSGLSEMSPGMHSIEFSGTGEDGNPLVRRHLFNTPGRPLAGTVYAAYFNIFNPKNSHDASEIVDVVYGDKKYATLSPDENGGIFVQFPILEGQEKFEATAKSRYTGKMMKVSVGVDKAVAVKTGIAPYFVSDDPEAQGGNGMVYQPPVDTVKGEEVGNFPIGVFPGEKVHIVFPGFKPNYPVNCGRYDLGDLTADSLGVVDKTVTMPDLRPGVHEIVLEGDTPGGAGVGYGFKVFYPGNPRAKDDWYSFYLTGFTPSTGDYDAREAVKIRPKIEDGGLEFDGNYPDEDGGIFFSWPTFAAPQGKLEFTATGQLTGKVIEVSIDIVD